MNLDAPSQLIRTVMFRKTPDVLTLLTTNIVSVGSVTTLGEHIRVCKSPPSMATHYSTAISFRVIRHMRFQYLATNRSRSLRPAQLLLASLECLPAHGRLPSP
ncbi:hypothetical protein L798_14235 [Zootermopsis nevadensis]|uniref:Uncharacterized protein n=1 Tax=Zootermopsis nevadensis TaxID=136037 RepID=A0A067QQY7_ZOONE|nr:hypothetical protein L798_14235 [Zootermopsis nevadensis]